MEQMQFASVTLTCKTEGCFNQNIDIESKVVYPSGNAFCGPCGKEIIFTMPDSPSE
jgi:hypothetical protein